MRKQVVPGGMIRGQYGETHQQTKVNIGSTAAGGRVSWQQLDLTDPDGDSVAGATILSGLFPLTFADFAASLWQRVHLQPLAKDKVTVTQQVLDLKYHSNGSTLRLVTDPFWSENVIRQFV